MAEQPKLCPRQDHPVSAVTLRRGPSSFHHFPARNAKIRSCFRADTTVPGGGRSDGPAVRPARLPGTHEGPADAALALWLRMDLRNQIRWSSGARDKERRGFE